MVVWLVRGRRGRGGRRRREPPPAAAVAEAADALAAAAAHALAAAAHAALAAAAAAHVLRVLRCQHRVPLQWSRRVRPMRLRHARLLSPNLRAVLLRGRPRELPQLGSVKLENRSRVYCLCGTAADCFRASAAPVVAASAASAAV